MSEAWTPTEHGQERRSLQRRVARGLTWTLIDTWGSQLIGLVIFAILARLLTPVDFGLVALAAVFVSFAALFVDLGLGDALIQRRALTRSQIDTAFWVSMAIGIGLAIAGILIAYPISVLVNEPAVAPIIAVLAITFVITALSTVQISLLRRELAFRRLAVRRLIALIASGVVGIAAASLGYGAWALVAQQLSYGTVSVIALWTVSPWRPRLHATRTDFRELSSFGIKVVSSDALGYASRNADNLLVGTFLGPAALGLYAVGYRILETTQTLLVAGSRKLAFPVLSHMQADIGRLRRAYGRVNRLVAVVIMPGYIGLALVAQEAIMVLFGQRWAQSGPVAAVLFLIGPALTVQVFSGSLLNATGHPGITLRFRILATTTHVIGFLIAVTVFRDIVAVAAAFVIGTYLLMPLNLYLQQRYAGIPIADHLLQLRWIAFATLVTAAAVLAAKVALLGQVSTIVLLAAEVAAGVIAFGVTLLLVERDLVRELVGVAAQTIPGAERVARAIRLPMPTAPLRRPTGREELEESLIPSADIDPVFKTDTER